MGHEQALLFRLLCTVIADGLRISVLLNGGNIRPTIPAGEIGSVLSTQGYCLFLFSDLRIHILAWFELRVPGRPLSGSLLCPGAGMCCAKWLQSCPTPRDPMDCSPPASSVHGVLQARILERVAVSFSRGSSQPRDQTCISYVSCTGRQVPYFE